MEKLIVLLDMMTKNVFMKDTLGDVVVMWYPIHVVSLWYPILQVSAKSEGVTCS